MMRFAIVGSGAVGRLFRREAGAKRPGRHVHRARRAPGGDPRTRAADSERQARRFRRAGRRRTTIRRRSARWMSCCSPSRPTTTRTALEAAAAAGRAGLRGADAAERRRQRRRDRGGGRRRRVLGGTTYVATALETPGVIVQTGVHRSIIFGEVFGDRARDLAARAGDRRRVAPADILVTPVADGRVPIWDKFVYLAPFSGFTGAARLPIGGIWTDPHVREMFYAAAREIAALAAAEGVHDLRRSLRAAAGVHGQHPADHPLVAADRSRDRASESRWRRCRAPPSAARRSTASPMPIISTLYATLRPWANGRSPGTAPAAPAAAAGTS